MDLISRQAAIDAAHRKILEKWELFHEKSLNELDVKDLLSELPSVEAVPVVHGRWVEKEVTDDLGTKVITEWQSCKCSSCGKYLTTPYLYYFTGYAYCPHCGAKMEGAEE